MSDDFIYLGKCFMGYSLLKRNRDDYMESCRRKGLDWKKRLDSYAGHLFYLDDSGEKASIETWLNRMTTYVYGPVEFRGYKEGWDHLCRTDKEEFRIPELAVPAFNERQADAIAEMMIKTYDGSSLMNDNEEPARFTGYITRPRLRCMRSPVRIEDFANPMDNEKRLYDGGSDDDDSWHWFLFDFIIKHGFDRGLRNAGKVDPFFDMGDADMRSFYDSEGMPRKG